MNLIVVSLEIGWHLMVAIMWSALWFAVARHASNRKENSDAR